MSVQPPTFSGVNQAFTGESTPVKVTDRASGKIKVITSSESGKTFYSFTINDQYVGKSKHNAFLYRVSVSNIEEIILEKVDETVYRIAVVTDNVKNDKWGYRKPYSTTVWTLIALSDKSRKGYEEIEEEIGYEIIETATFDGYVSKW